MAKELNEVLVSVRNMEVTFGSKRNKFVAVHGVSFDIYKGETFGLVGESGCGKSTLGKCMMRLTDLTEGQVLFQGKDISSQSRKALRSELQRMQMIFQDAAGSFHPRRRIADTIQDSVRSLLGRDSRADIPALCDMVGLAPELAQRYPRDLSGGQCQRFAIARAIASSPRVLLCDEITSALDVSSQAQILALLSFLRREKNMSMIFVSHDLAVVSTLCDRIIVMHGGKIVEEGETERIISSPQNEYTKELTASVMEL